ncbi:MAG: hypothetical protein LBE36_08575 [Flavobacteriaceae bacterium]|jgi:hypothetical protein|nr:hypothetical protein [Flavobacteriaceae bacterium]
MTVVNSKEFIDNENIYFDMAINDELFIKRGKNLFQLVCTTVGDNTEDTADDHDENYITKDELLAGIYEDIDKFYANTI